MTHLTPRETQVLQLAAAGHDHRQIAQILGIAYQTARKHMVGIHAAYGTENKVQAVVAGIRRGDVDLAAAYAGIVHRQE